MKINKSVTKYFILSFLVSFILIFFFYGNFESYFNEVSSYGDNESYFQLTQNFLSWDYSTFVYHPFGISILISVITLLTTIDPVILMVILNIIFAYLSVLIINSILNYNSAIWFLIFGYEFTIISFLGGSEIATIFFILLSLILYKYEYKKLSFFAASFSYFVRPWSIALPIAFAIHLLIKKDKKNFIKFLAISLLMFFIYLSFSYLIYGPGLIFEGYKSNSALIVGEKLFIEIPFIPILKEIMRPSIHIPITNIIKNTFYIFLILVGFAFMIMNCKKYFKDEILRVILFFTTFQIILIFTYNSPWTFHEFPRYSILILPFIVFSLKDFLFTNKILIIFLILLSSVFNAFSAVGYKNYIIFLLNNFSN